jgi:hypothetical protein
MKQRIAVLLTVVALLVAMMVAMAMSAFAQAPHMSCKAFGTGVARFAQLHQGQQVGGSNPPETAPKGGVNERVLFLHERFCEPG